MLLPYMLLFLRSTQTTSSTKGRLPASTCRPPCPDFSAATYRDLLHLGGGDRLHRGRGERLQRAIGRLRQHPLGLHRLHLLLDGDRLHLGGCHQALDLRLKNLGKEEGKVTRRRNVPSPWLQQQVRGGVPQSHPDSPPAAEEDVHSHSQAGLDNKNIP